MTRRNDKSRDAPTREHNNFINYWFLCSRSTCQHVDPFKPFVSVVSNLLKFDLFSFNDLFLNFFPLQGLLFVNSSFLSVVLFRNAYRAEVATFLVPVAGEDAAAVRLRERIEFSSNILFFIEDLYLALGPGHVTTQAGSQINVVASLLWVRNQHAANLKELMIAKMTGWQVLRNFINQVYLCSSISLL